MLMDLIQECQNYVSSLTILMNPSNIFVDKGKTFYQFWPHLFFLHECISHWGRELGQPLGKDNVRMPLASLWQCSKLAIIEVHTVIRMFVCTESNTTYFVYSMYNYAGGKGNCKFRQTYILLQLVVVCAS